MSRVILRPHMVSALAGCLLACSAYAADPGATVTSSTAQQHVPESAWCSLVAVPRVAPTSAY